MFAWQGTSASLQDTPVCPGRDDSLGVGAGCVCAAGSLLWPEPLRGLCWAHSCYLRSQTDPQSASRWQAGSAPTVPACPVGGAFELARQHWGHARSLMVAPCRSEGKGPVVSCSLSSRGLSQPDGHCQQPKAPGISVGREVTVGVRPGGWQEPQGDPRSCQGSKQQFGAAD